MDVGRTNEKGAFQTRTNGQLGAVVGTNKVTVAVAAAADAPPMDGNEMISTGSPDGWIMHNQNAVGGVPNGRAKNLSS